MDNLTRPTGTSAVLAGLSWCVAVVLHNTQPQGCVGESCAVRPMRESTALTEVLFLLAGAALAVSMGGLLLMVRRREAHVRIGWIARVACALAIILFSIAALMSAVHPDWNGMPLVVLPAVATLVLGLVLLVVLLWTTRLLPRVVIILLLVTVVLLPLANEQTSMILWTVPFGLAWAALGAFLLTGRQGNVAEKS